jgi:hypothetical protein
MSPNLLTTYWVQDGSLVGITLVVLTFFGVHRYQVADFH